MKRSHIVQLALRFREAPLRRPLHREGNLIASRKQTGGPALLWSSSRRMVAVWLAGLAAGFGEKTQAACLSGMMPASHSNSG